MSLPDSGHWDADNHERLLRMLDGPAGLAVFDFDNTLIYNDLGEAAMYYALFQGLIPGQLEEYWQQLASYGGFAPEQVQGLRDLFDCFYRADNEDCLLQFVDIVLQQYNAMYTTKGMEAAYRWSALCFAWIPVSEWEQIGRYVLAAETRAELASQRLPSGLQIPRGIRVYPEIRHLIQALQARDWQIRIVTASPRELIAAVISNWGLQPDQVIGMQLARNAEGEYLPEIIEPLPFQQGKLDILYASLGEKRALDFAAGDSPGDSSILQAARVGLWIDRGHPEMARLAARHAHIMRQKPFPSVVGA
ncbi:MAG: haloacid dehalogenase-like hydrolase [Leptospiraceae bacterium]|nr:haloacid dehalogenase-like hydrolase [Leptospiraceae bacterium]